MLVLTAFRSVGLPDVLSSTTVRGETLGSRSLVAEPSLAGSVAQIGSLDKQLCEIFWSAEARSELRSFRFSIESAAFIHVGRIWAVQRSPRERDSSRKSASSYIDWNPGGSGRSEAEQLSFLLCDAKAAAPRCRSPENCANR